MKPQIGILATCAAAILLAVAASKPAPMRASAPPAAPRYPLPLPSRVIYQTSFRRGDGIPRRVGRTVIMEGAIARGYSGLQPPAHPHLGASWRDARGRLLIWDGASWWLALEHVRVNDGILIGNDPAMTR